MEVEKGRKRTRRNADATSVTCVAMPGTAMDWNKKEWPQYNGEEKTFSPMVMELVI